MSSNLNAAQHVPPIVSSNVDFPFNFLHAELVRHFRERDSEISEKKKEWMEQIKQSDFSDVLMKDNSIVSNMIFAQVVI